MGQVLRVKRVISRGLGRKQNYPPLYSLFFHNVSLWKSLFVHYVAMTLFGHYGSCYQSLALFLGAWEPGSQTTTGSVDIESRMRGAP